jgi:hypothetical protein
MVMYDCHGDCEEPAVGFGGHFYAVAWVPSRDVVYG